MSEKLFERIAFIGIGLIGSSLARVVRRDGLASEIAVAARRRETLDAVKRLNLADQVTDNPAEAAAGADIVVICTPLGAYEAVAKAIAPALKPGAIVTDVGSVKASAIAAIKPHLPEGVHFVPGHPLAGTEHSGPESGFPELFDGRWCVLTPEADTDQNAIARVRTFWQAAGSKVEVMDPGHHDQVLAITSHLPHLIAYTIVDTATQLSTDLQKEVIEFSATGFRDFTRIAASDPVMWRDIFLNNREAVLEILGRFTEDLTAMQRMIRRGDGDGLEEVFTKTRAVRRGVIDAKQA
ncbi:MAG: prephenate/arogenate dehydrogenase family protein [Rhodospirillales bacterium]